MAAKQASTPAPKKGRTPIAPAQDMVPALNTDALEARNGELVAMNAHQQQLVEQFGDGLPWHPDHYESAIRIEIGRSAESFLRAGRMLLVARACCVHGEWGGMLKRLNLGETSALHMMAWARQIAGLPNPARVQDLQAAASTIGKMIELSRLPAEQFKQLAEEGTTGELALDDVASMTRDELADAVRELRADKEAKDQRIAKLSEDVNKAEEKATKAARKWKSADPDERQVMLEKRVTEAKLAIVANIGGEKSGLTAAFLELADHCNENDLDCRQFMGDVIGELLVALRTLRDEYSYGFEVPLVNDRGA